MSAFVAGLRTRPEGIDLTSDRHVPESATRWTIRVQCAEAWDAVRAMVTPDTTVAGVKQAAMAVLMPDVDNRDEYVVKLHGFEVAREDASIESAGVRDGSTLLVMSRRRRAVR